jgi:hypothetical protein
MCSLPVAVLSGVFPVVLLVLVLDLVPPVARVLVLFLDLVPRVARKMPVLGGCGRCILTNILFSTHQLKIEFLTKRLRNSTILEIVMNTMII